MTPRHHLALDRLRAAATGTVLTPSDAGYHEAITPWNRSTTHTPSVVLVAADAADVATAVAIAADTGLGVGVQATGHGVVRPVDDLLIVTDRLTELAVDAPARTVTVGAGCRWGDVLAAAAPHGLAPLMGSSPTVGVVGFTLGGGIGWLARKYGAACDAVRRLRVVLADGTTVTATADEHGDLFDALRGGGGGVLGIVTELEMDLVPVDQVYAGNLVYPARDAAAVAAGYAAWVRSLPDEMSTSLVFMNFPPDPAVPPPLRGRSTVIVRGCWSGELSSGAAIVDSWRAHFPPELDLWSTIPFAAAASISNDPLDPKPIIAAGAWMTELDGRTGEVIAGHTFPGDGPPALMLTEVRHLGGAVSRLAATSPSMAGRQHPFVLSSLALGQPGAGDDGPTSAQRSLLAALAPSIATETNHNFLSGERRRAATATSTAPDRHDALRALQARLDPGDVFRYGVDHR